MSVKHALRAIIHAKRLVQMYSVCIIVGTSTFQVYSSRAESLEMLDQVPSQCQSQSSPLADEPPPQLAHVHTVAHVATPLACSRAANGSSLD